MTTTIVDASPDHGVHRFIRRHPYLSFLLIFNTVGQAAAFVPVIAARVYGVEVGVDLWLIVPTLLFLLLPALVITRIARGRDGLHHLLRSMFRFRVHASWYLLPLLVVPALTLATALPAPPDVTVQKILVVYLTTFLPALLFQFLTTNWWEETVWLGFFQAPLQDRFGPWRAVLLTTPFFALEHISLVFGGTVGEGLVQFALILLVTLPTRALLAWVYNRTGSLAVAGLVHASSNAAGLSLVPQLFHSPGGGGSALLLLGIIVIVATRGRLGLPRRPRPAAAPTPPDSTTTPPDSTNPTAAAPTPSEHRTAPPATTPPPAHTRPPPPRTGTTMPNRSTAPSTTTTTWTTAGVIALPLSAVLLAVGTLTPQPDQASDPDGWARFVTSTSYLPSHIATTLVGAALMIVGTFALTVLIAGRTPRLAPTGMLLAVTGQVFFSVPAVVSTFVTPAIGQAYLNGNQAIMTLEFPAAMTAVTLVALLLTVVGNILLGVAAARSGVVPRWAGIVWATGTVIFYLLGFALGVATTGASLPTQPVGAALLAISGTAMAWAAAHRVRTGSPDRRPHAAVTVPSQQ